MTANEHATPVTVYVSIGNSDDKLTQAEWSLFYEATDKALRSAASTVHGQWASDPTSPWQNACWCLTIVPNQQVITWAGEQKKQIDWVRERLAQLAHTYCQGSIAWAEAVTEFIPAKPAGRA